MDTGESPPPKHNKHNQKITGVPVVSTNTNGWLKPVILQKKKNPSNADMQQKAIELKNQFHS
jgi:hypothetical protein